MTVAQRVENILQLSVKARNSDKELWIIYAQKSGMDLSQRQLDILRDMPSFETLRRTRQSLQESGKYRASEDVRRQRRIKSTLMREAMPQSRPERAEEIIEQSEPVQQLLNWLER